MAKVNVFKYTCVGTIEERIDDILQRKQDLFDKLIDDVSLDISTRLSSEELFGLFGLESPSQVEARRYQGPSGNEGEKFTSNEDKMWHRIWKRYGL